MASKPIVLQVDRIETLAGDNFATETYVNTEVSTLRSDILGGASAAYDTLQEIETYITDNDSDIASIMTTMVTKAPLPATVTQADEFLTWTGSAFQNDASTLPAINAAITTNAGDITNLQSNQLTLMASVNSHTTQIGQNTTDIATLTTDLGVAESDILANATAIAANAAKITTNEGDILTNATAIAANAGRLTVNEANIASLQNSVATNTTLIGNNASDIADNRADLTAAIGDITTLQSTVAVNTTDIATLVSDVSGLTSSVNTNTANINSVSNALNGKAPLPPTQTSSGDFLYFDGSVFRYGTPSGGGSSSSTSVSGTGGILIGYYYTNSTTAESFSADGYSSALLELTTTGKDSVFYFSFNGTVVINGVADVNVHFRTKDPAVGTWSNWIDTTCAYRRYQNDGFGVLKQSAHPLIGIHRPTDHAEYSTLPAGWGIQYGVSIEVSAGTIYFPRQYFTINASLMELAA